ncbi:hypothetical protein FHS23_000934 [Prauserella isguenensis]|uniref:DUF1772 domain-containing protein n=1 Tax=Prauserella isguenensis TaxID=1470180 RepID=A0A839RZD6_9PSEU|nr:hypothetical protein [Prauserella isguenensis]
MSRLRFCVSAAYVWLAMVAFGGIAVETIVIYPNVFHDVPRSLTEASSFFDVTGPADFFPPMGAATLIAAVVTLLLVRKVQPANWWFTASFTSLSLGEFLFSMLYFWPRNETMFDEGTAVHSAELLTQTAVEFEVGHWFRLGMSTVTATLAFVGLLRLHRYASVQTPERITAGARS